MGLYRSLAFYIPIKLFTLGQGKNICIICNAQYHSSYEELYNTRIIDMLECMQCALIRVYRYLQLQHIILRYHVRYQVIAAVHRHSTQVYRN